MYNYYKGDDIVKFKVIKKENSVILRTTNFKIVASEPSIQPFHTYILNDKKDIFHFYYNLKMYRKPYKGKWEKVISSYVTEFGIMPYVADALNNILKSDVTKEGIVTHFKEKDNDGNTVVSKEEFEATKTFVLSGLLNEDRLEITKTIRVFNDCRGHNEFEYYDVNFIIGGSELGTLPIGASLLHLEKVDIEQIILFAETFVDMAIKKTQNSIENALNDDTESKYNTPKIVRDHLKKKYNIDNWRPIFLKLHTEEYIIDEYIDYITQKKDITQLKCHEWHGEKRNMQKLLETMKDFEAYLFILNDNRNI